MISTWSAFELAVVRAAGFPYALLERLADPGLLEHMARIAAARRRRQELREQFTAAATAVPPPAVPALAADGRAGFRAVRRGVAMEPGTGERLEARLGLAGWVQAWNSAVSELEAEEVGLPGRYARALATAREVLAELLRDERVREALFLLTPELLDGSAGAVLRRPPRGEAPNQDERKLASYVQRLCAKCETNAFAGPIAYATRAPSPRWAPTAGASERRGLLAYRAAEEVLLRALERASDVRDRPVRLGPAADLATLPPALRRLLDEIEAGAPTWADAAARARTAVPTPAQAARLHRSAVAWTGRPIEPSEPDALRSLRAAAAASSLPGGGSREQEPDLAATAEALATLAGRFAESGLDGKRAALAEAECLLRGAGVSELRRGSGELYADRVVLHEEDLENRDGLELSPDAWRRFAEILSPALDVAAAASLEAWRTACRQLAEAFGETFQGRDCVPLPEYLRRMPLTARAPLEETAVGRGLAAAVAARWDGRALAVDLPPEATAPLGADILQWTGGLPLLASPDVFLAAHSRDEAMEGGRLVVGEVHWGLQGLSNLCLFVEDRAALAGALRAWLGVAATGSAELAHVVLGERYGKLCFLEVLPATLELSGPAAVGQRRLRPAQLGVRGDLGLVELRTGRRVLLLLGDADAASQTPLGPPAIRFPRLELGPRTPRVSIGGVVVQRASWRVPAAELTALRALPPARRHLALVETFREQGVPDRVFVTLPHEPKPVHVHLGSPHLVELLLASVRESDVLVAEMLPGPDEMWLGDSLAPRACELRLACLRGPVP
jgi:hypothetical protein